MPLVAKLICTAGPRVNKQPTKAAHTHLCSCGCNNKLRSQRMPLTGTQHGRPPPPVGRRLGGGWFRPQVPAGHNDMQAVKHKCSRTEIHDDASILLHPHAQTKHVHRRYAQSRGAAEGRHMHMRYHMYDEQRTMPGLEMWSKRLSMGPLPVAWYCAT